MSWLSCNHLECNLCKSLDRRQILRSSATAHHAHAKLASYTGKMQEQERESGWMWPLCTGFGNQMERAARMPKKNAATDGLSTWIRCHSSCSVHKPHQAPTTPVRCPTVACPQSLGSVSTPSVRQDALIYGPIRPNIKVPIRPYEPCKHFARFTSCDQARGQWMVQSWSSWGLGSVLFGQNKITRTPFIFILLRLLIF
jgi:hypothetical protein